MTGQSLPRQSWFILLTLAFVVLGLTAAGALFYLKRMKPADPAAVQQAPPPQPEPVSPTPPEPVAPALAGPPPTKTDPPIPPTPPVAGNPPLREVAIAAPALPGTEVTPIVYMEPPALEGPNDPVTGLLRRELYRQAVLLAAREELGLTTRDGTLGDLPPTGLAANQRLLVSAELAVGRPHRVRIEAGAGRELWRAEGAGPAITDEAPTAAVVAAEAFSRGGYVTALNRIGFKVQPNKTDASGTVAPEVDAWLGQMNFPSQFFAVRALHAAAHKSGESPGLLGALVRAYANLGMLTDAQWGAMPWVFKARSLLYAQRLVARDPAAAWGYWHRAYAAALTGLHAAALEDLKLAANAVGAPAGVPEWVSLAEALCKFDSSKLKTVFPDARLGETARVFHFLTVESASSRTLAALAGTAVVLKYPECDRVHDAMAALGLTERGGAPPFAFRNFAERFARRVREAPGLPKSVADVLAKTPPEPELVRALVDAGSPAVDSADPSWCLLGRFAQESRVVQVASRLEFLKEDLKAPADSFFQTAAPLVAGHPLYPFLETYVIDSERWPQEYQDRLRAAWVPALSYRHWPLLKAQQKLGRDQSVRASHVAQVHGDWLYYDAALFLRQTRDSLNSSQYARRMLWVSPHAPAARAALIRHDPAVPSELLATWEAEAQHPEIFEALASKAIRAGKWDDAQKYFRRAMELTPDLIVYRLIAEDHRRRGEIDKYVATLEDFLKTEDSGLDHARVRVELANHYLSIKQFRKAQAHAEAAAESGAAPALQCAAKCAEAMEEWPKAEAHVRKLSEQFPDMVGIWMFWCHRTAHGDVAAADKLVEQRLSQIKGEPTPSELLTAAAYRALTGKPELAPALFQSAHRKKRNDGALLLAASLSDTLQDAGNRERYLNEVEFPSQFAAAKSFFFAARNESEEFVPTEEAMDKAVKGTSPAGRALVAYAVGMYVLRRGETERAKQYLNRVIAESDPKDTIPAALAGEALRSMAKK